MFAIGVIVACLINQPAVCSRFEMPSVADDLSHRMTFSECLGIGGQAAAKQWEEENPGWKTKRILCSVGNDPYRLQHMLNTDGKEA